MNQQGNTTPSDGHPAPPTDMPESLYDMVTVVGLPDTMKIVKEYGGTRLFVPKHVNAQHHLANLLGIEQASILSGHFGGENLTIPRMAKAARAERNQEIIRRYDAREPVRTLAHAFNLTDRQIYTILSSTV